MLPAQSDLTNILRLFSGLSDAEKHALTFRLITEIRPNIETPMDDFLKTKRDMQAVLNTYPVHEWEDQLRPFVEAAKEQGAFSKNEDAPRQVRFGCGQCAREAPTSHVLPAAPSRLAGC